MARRLEREDPIEWLMRRAMYHLQGIPPGSVEFSNRIILLLQEARVTWGGKRVYIPMSPRQIKRSGAIAEPDVPT